MSPNRDEYPNQVFLNACRAVEQRIKKDPFCIIAIGGKLGVGKTTLSRYLSWKLGLSLLETDLFLRPKETKVSYDYKYIRDILEFKKKSERHVIVEGCSILPVLREFDSSETFLIYIEKQITSGHPSIDQIDFEITETFSIKDIFDVDLDCPSELKEKAGHTIVVNNTWIQNGQYAAGWRQSTCNK